MLPRVLSDRRLTPSNHSPLPETTIPLRSHDEAILVLGPYDRFAKLLRQALDIEVFTRAGNLRLKGRQEDVSEAQRRIEHVLGKSRKGRDLDLRTIEGILAGKELDGHAPERREPVARRASAAMRQATSFRVRPVEPRGENQRIYWELVEKRPLTFALGAAGTGKTFLAVAAAVRMLRQGVVRRLVITRPVVEAGEHLGFLPGDLQQKLNPYMRPIYDALFDLLEPEALGRLEEAGVIEVAPLAYMRGRTLSNAFVILDEGQNTSIGQMKMFLTRMGDGSRMVVTGDPTQNDLPPNQRSGLLDAVQRLRGFEGIGVVEFETGDIVRHPLVMQIVRAYQAPTKTPREEEED
jgi:phosphate starvation-inducible PhoH-like protein